MAKIKKIPNGRGFDIVVWQKGREDPVYVAAYTTPGREYLKRWLPYVRMKVAYKMDGIFPEGFLGRAPKELKIGGISEGAKVPVRINPPLH